jgi:hypothetical protein
MSTPIPPNTKLEGIDLYAPRGARTPSALLPYPAGRAVRFASDIAETPLLEDFVICPRGWFAIGAANANGFAFAYPVQQLSSVQGAHVHSKLADNPSTATTLGSKLSRSAC